MILIRHGSGGGATLATGYYSAGFQPASCHIQLVELRSFQHELGRPYIPWRGGPGRSLIRPGGMIFLCGGKKIDR